MDFEKAQATVPTDKELIRNEIEKTAGEKENAVT